MKAIILVSDHCTYSSLSTAMFRIAARLPGILPGRLAFAAFTGMRPFPDEAIERCLAGGVDEIIVQPMALGVDRFVRDELPALVARYQEILPQIRFRIGAPIGDHPALADLVLYQVASADYLAHRAQESWEPCYVRTSTGIVLLSAAMEAAQRAAQRIAELHRETHVRVLNVAVGAYGLKALANEWFSHGIRYMVLALYLLGCSNAEYAAAREYLNELRVAYPSAVFLLADPLSYDRRLLQAVVDRIGEAR